MYERCIWCERIIPLSSEPFCRYGCKSFWYACERDAEIEIERERDERIQDPNAGCWSYSW